MNRSQEFTQIILNAMFRNEKALHIGKVGGGH